MTHYNQAHTSSYTTVSYNILLDTYIWRYKPQKVIFDLFHTDSY